MGKNQDLKKVIGAWLRDSRQRKDLTQEHLAGIIGVSPKYYSEIERGRRNITIDTLQRIVSSLDMTATDLIGLLLNLNPHESGLPSQVTIRIKRGDEKAKKNIVRVVDLLLEDEK